MKRIFTLIMAVLMICLLVSCQSKPDTEEPKEDVVTIEDGYLVVNGNKTEHKVHTEPQVSVIDGYVVVNGEKTEYKVETDDVIEVVDGYLVVNGVKTEYMVVECNHSWKTVTTAPTCTAGGYDTMTCSLCGKRVTANETEKADHTYGENYVIDNDYHWFKCISCDDKKDKELHTLGDDGICATCQLPVSATPGVVYDISVDGTYAEVIRYTGTATKVKIAEEYNGLPVKNIYGNAFSNTTITSVVIPDSVTSIGEYAFNGCPALTSVVIPDSVTIIGYNAFSGCHSLTSVVIPDSVTIIADGAFQHCTALTSVVIPDSVTSIGEYAFNGCTALEFNEYGNCKYLGSANNPYFALIKSLNTNMSSYEIHNDTNIIAGSAFYGCQRLTSVVIPDSVVSIGEDVFDYCYALTSVVIGNGVTSVGDQAFYGCPALTSVVIGDSVTSIGDQAFSDCPALTSVVIPDSVTSIGYDAFWNCYALSNVYYTGSEANWTKISIDNGNDRLTRLSINYNYVPEE